MAHLACNHGKRVLVLHHTTVHRQDLTECDSHTVKTNGIRFTPDEVRQSSGLSTDLVSVLDNQPVTDPYADDQF